MVNTFNVIRYMTDKDKYKIIETAYNFCNRYNIKVIDCPLNAINYHLFELKQQGNDDYKQLSYNWQKCLCRSVTLPYNKNLTVDYGHGLIYLSE